MREDIMEKLVIDKFLIFKKKKKVMDYEINIV